MPYFIAMNEQGPSWIAGTPMREQAEWKEHAEFINGLMRNRFILLGGPLAGKDRHRAMLVIQAASADDVRGMLGKDPWVTSGILTTTSVEPWQILVSHDLLDPVLAELGRP